jgi:hypothetical protein
MEKTPRGRAQQGEFVVGEVEAAALVRGRAGVPADRLGLVPVRRRRQRPQDRRADHAHRRGRQIRHPLICHRGGAGQQYGDAYSLFSVQLRVDAGLNVGLSLGVARGTCGTSPSPGAKISFSRGQTCRTGC